MKELTVCASKKFFDTEFEATISAAKTERMHGGTFKPYRCSTHFHITHVDIKERKGAGAGFARCPHCKKLIKHVKMQQHPCEMRDRLHGRG